ncbi:unnamed protein product [Anisakis simplex]|uniref:Uncharacterized protein n=1 Tax=Anisakis simplex TaxID=6269 RepID=A0A3P6Q3T5_ANISI|nr:unnamed protein product [Anisakis simplex]
MECFVPDADLNLLSTLVSTRQKTLGDRPFETVESVRQYGIGTSGTMMKAIMRVLIANKEQIMHSLGDRNFRVHLNEQTNEVVDALAEAMALVNLLR